MSAWPCALWRCRADPPPPIQLLCSPRHTSPPPPHPGALPGDVQRAALQGNILSSESLLLVGWPGTWLKEGEVPSSSGRTLITLSKGVLSMLSSLLTPLSVGPLGSSTTSEELLFTKTYTDCQAPLCSSALSNGTFRDDRNTRHLFCPVW